MKTVSTSTWKRFSVVVVASALLIISLFMVLISNTAAADVIAAGDSPIISGINAPVAVEDDLIITAVFDGPLTGGTPKGVELYVVNDILDLSIYGLGSANNGGGSNGEEFTFPADSVTAGDFIYVASESTGFEAFFGFAPDYTSGAMSINGDDAVELFTNGSESDIFGDINVDGNGEPWEYMDGWAYRNDETGPDGITFVLGNWSFSGANALDGETSNDTAATPVPIGTYTPAAGAGSFAIGKAAPELVAPGDLLTYTIAITNNTGITTTGTIITDVVPANSTFASASDGGTESGGVVSWTVAGDFVADTSIERTFMVTATTSNGVDIVNDDYGVVATEWVTMAVGSPVTTTVSPLDLSIAKTGLAYGVVGDTVMYTITLDNQGVANAENVTITDTLPVSTTYVSSDMGSPVATDPYVWDLGTVLSDTTSTYYITVTVDLDVASGTIITNNIYAATSTAGDDLSNNDGWWAMPVYEFVPIATARAGADGEIFGVEGKIIYVPGTYNYGGWGLQDATGGIAVYYTPPPTVNLGDTVRLIGVRGVNNGVAQLGSPIFFENLGSGAEVVPLSYSTSDLDSGSSEGWLIVVTGDVSNLSCPSDNSFDIDDGSGAAAIYIDSTTGVDVCAMGVSEGDAIGVIGFSTQYNGNYQLMPRRPADIILSAPTIGKTSPAIVDPGELYTYTLTVENYLGYDLTDVVVTDTLPVSTTFAYASDGGVLAGGVVSWTVPTIGNATAVIRTFAVTATTVVGTEIVNADYGLRADNYMTSTFGSPITTTVFANVCGAIYTPIYVIQGSGSSSPSEGDNVFTEGVVTAVYQGAEQLNGFYIQDEMGDGNTATSDGIFVYTSMTAVAGDAVRVAGQVTEYDGLTELTNVSSILVCGTGMIAPTAVSLPVATLDTWEQYEGMLLNFPQGLYVTEHYDLGRYGEVSLSVDDRLYNPTNITTPGAAAIAQQELNDRSRILLDDTYTDQNRDPIAYPDPGLTYTNTLRGGDYVANLIGVVDYFNDYRIQPVGTVDFTHVNTRTAAAEDVGGNLTVASFNVLNYFNGDGQGGGFPTSRGANTLSEFNRQRIKIINAIVAMDADIIGLMEIENDGYGTYSAIQDLVNGLNVATAPGTYAFVNPLTPTIGTDDIAVGLLYQPARVTLAGDPQILDSSVDPTFNDDKNRPVLTQSFTESISGEIVTIAVNHLKSKGSNCDGLGDPDIGDGQGNCNLTRESAAQALVNWLATDPTGSGSAYNLIIGDLNAYAMEDPITAITDAGYDNLLSDFGGLYAYSYVYAGQHGYLDHALSSAALTPFVTGATTWHINADEPRNLDYNEEFKTANQLVTLYGEGPYRASDHDPVVVGLSLRTKIYLPIIMNSAPAAP